MNVNGIAKALADKHLPVPMQVEAWTGMPRYEVLGYAAASIEVLGGIMILIGFKTRFAAAVLFLFTIATVVVSHDFWNMDGAAQLANQTQALKNLSIMGALLMIVAAGPGRLSFDTK
jgi:putative oxidoreductase